MTIEIIVETLSAEAFAEFGEVIETKQEPTVVINRGMCQRYSDLAQLSIDAQGELGISVFNAKAYALPLTLDYVERHPLGSQAFIPMHSEPFLVVVAKDVNGTPDTPKAFMSQTGQGVNYHRGVWHGVLTPLLQDGLFAVVDRIGPGENLEEHWFADRPIIYNRNNL